jgi:hypothetical protein
MAVDGQFLFCDGRFLAGWGFLEDSHYLVARCILEDAHHLIVWCISEAARHSRGGYLLEEKHHVVIHDESAARKQTGLA